MAQPEDTLKQEIGNPGDILRQAREEKGWTIAEVANKLNLTAQRVNEVEQGAFDKVPGHTFARGYVRSYAKLLGIPQEELVEAFDRYTHTDAGGSPVHSLTGVEKLRRQNSGKSTRIGLLLFLLLVAAGAAYYWWQQSEAETVAEVVMPARTMPEHVEVDNADGTTQIHSLVGADSSGSNSLPLPLSDAEPSIEVVTPNVDTDETATADDSAAEPAAAPTSATDAEPTLTMTFSANCWVQVNDAKGNIMVREEKKNGDVLTLTGEAPFQVRLGYARAVSMTYDGKPVDIEPFTRGQTANMTVGASDAQ